MTNICIYAPYESGSKQQCFVNLFLFVGEHKDGTVIESPNVAKLLEPYGSPADKYLKQLNTLCQKGHYVRGQYFL